MTTVKSDLNLAQMYASQLRNACQSLTTIAVASQISAAVTLTSERLHSVASDFEALDEAAANGFRSNT